MVWHCTPRELTYVWRPQATDLSAKRGSAGSVRESHSIDAAQRVIWCRIANSITQFQWGMHYKLVRFFLLLRSCEMSKDCLLTVTNVSLLNTVQARLVSAVIGAAKGMLDAL